MFFDQKKVKLLLGAFALLGVFSMPYGYYTFLRIIVTLGCAFLLLGRDHEQGNIQIMVWIIIGVLFNPVIPIYLDRDLWKIIDIITSFIFLGSALFIKNAPVK